MRTALASLALCLAACGEGPADSSGAKPLPSFAEATEIPLAGRGEGERDFLLSQAPDGRGWVFTRMGPDNALQLLTVKDPFSGEEPKPLFPGVRGDADAVFDPAGGTLLFMSTGRHGDPERDDYDFYEATWEKGRAYGERPLEGLNTEHSEIYLTASQDGPMVFASSRPGGVGGNDLYEAVPSQDGYDIRALDELNSPASDSNPFIFPSGEAMIFFSAKPGGFGGPDLYVTRRGDDGVWGEPVNLGEKVNTSGPDYAPSLSVDGRTLLFARGPSIFAIDVAAVEALSGF
ncbi:hypothetical protein HK107_11375 [Parvularcula sp. ZS-1/3]|uniref:Uncharacterized protein n=1 Tax=Parvularcula mediterranea TaxID=2732508 RepID=A0A7Y3RMQ9_9PROT|nr:PD40 domain-containing protein [Parvularcula mediterranea]NNU16919.1 hypothetical protein [Parvularcula mediterranea]